MKRTELARTASYATAPPGSRGPVKGVVPQGCGVQHRTLDGVAGGKIIAGVKRFDEECPLIFFASCLKPLTHSGYWNPLPDHRSPEPSLTPTLSPRCIGARESIQESFCPPLSSSMANGDYHVINTGLID